MKALLGFATLLALCSCAAQLGTGTADDDSGGAGDDDSGSGTPGAAEIKPGLQPAADLALRADPDVKAIGDACVQAEKDWKQSCGCALKINFDLTKPNYTHHRIWTNDQRLMVKYMCQDITDNIHRICSADATDMCKMSTLNMVRVDLDQLNFTVTGSTGNAQLNWDDFETDTAAFSAVLTGSVL